VINLGVHLAVFTNLHKIRSIPRDVEGDIPVGSGALGVGGDVGVAGQPAVFVDVIEDIPIYVIPAIQIANWLPQVQANDMAHNRGPRVLLSRNQREGGTHKASLSSEAVLLKIRLPAVAHSKN